ncbi:MAG TPA: arginine--tRNA ligase [Gemmatimonadales bacterium]|nr:arginine--tRNA ligase [Gemmatimonadales bacterium]
MLYREIEDRLRAAVVSVLPEAAPESIQVRPCPDPQFGDYQSVALMQLARQRRTNPRQLAQEVVGRLDVSDICSSVEVAGPGFINFRLRPDAIAQALKGPLSGGSLFFEPAARPRTVVIDFSSPNVAKPMHVGHIRSTILGDALTRVMRLLGHRVITDNHIGDWGTQFGKLLVGWKTRLDPAALVADPIAELERLYREVNTASESDPAVLEEARRELVKLQEGDEENLRIWREMIALSQTQFDAIYDRLDIAFDHTLGESFYNPRLRSVVDELRRRGIARESEGAVVVFFDDDPQLRDHPALIQKSDGAANYATTDLATLEHRLTTWKPDLIIYVTDGRQQLHFQQIFAIFRRWHPDVPVDLAHVWFGSILGPDNRPFKTRAGEVIKLADLLDEAEERAFAVVSEKSPELPEAARREIARVVGIGAVKYADLSPNRQSDYVFDWDRMLALSGNTAPYLQYAYARIRSIFRRGEVQLDSGTPIVLEAPEELGLARGLLEFGLTLEAVVEDYRPNLLCTYLYDLAGRFARFYEACPVLKADEPQRSSRLALCELTGRVLQEGLAALGIKTLEQM